MEECPYLPPEVLEPILIGFNLKELVGLKGVCQSWYTFIPTTRFHLNRLKYNNDQNNENNVGDTRIFMPKYEDPYTFRHSAVHDTFLDSEDCHLLGSSNGLVCISPFGNQVIVANPFTREVRKLQNLPIPRRENFCWGFGYDLSTDDYKIVVGFKLGKNQTCFQVLSLKSNVWKVIGEVNYSFFGKSGVLCNGALHWLMFDKNNNQVILSFDLSKEEFKEIPRPNDPRYVCAYTNYLGIIQNCLCIYPYYNDSHYKLTWLMNNVNVFPLWVMKNYNVKQSWELLPYKPDLGAETAHSLKNRRNYSQLKTTMFNDHICSSTTGEYIGAPIYVQSVVSPFVNGTSKRKRRAKNNQTKLKLIKGETSSSSV